MASLASKDVYFQKLASKVCVSQKKAPRERPFVPFCNGANAGPAKKKKQKSKQNQTGGKMCNAEPQAKIKHKSTTRPKETEASSADQNASKENINDKSAVRKEEVGDSRDFSAVDILRQKLHEKIEKSHGHDVGKTTSSEAREKKQQRRKQERERKKRKRKEFRMKKLAEKMDKDVKIEDEERSENSTIQKSGAPEKDLSSLVYNKIDAGKEFMSKEQMKKEKKKSVKGNLTPLTGKNYKQLLNRVESRKAKLEELRGKDEAKAKEMEEKMKWTNVLYKAEGLKIKDNEDLLRASLKRKEKMRTQRKKRWEQRSTHVLEKMQHRQDKRRDNIQKRKHAKMERRKEKARKKGRVLPGDLEG
ncbi:surfeit locus protein 6 isoform X2 [Paramormyrops kingsleyae]|nr:surfeit locus protein 6 isoform X2 [Paramormyrops kingsleyae]